MSSTGGGATGEAGRRGLRVLVTGGAGLIGRELCGALAERGHGVVALVHRSRALRRNDGRAMAVSEWAGGVAPGEVAVVAGDVSLPSLGLAPEVARRLAGAVDVVVHAAAVTGFTLEPEVYERVNVGGMRNVLGFAGLVAPGVPLLQVSTAYVCGDRDGPVPETCAEVGVDEVPVRFSNGYEASKAAAERLVAAARRGGQRAVVARPSIVVGTAAEGVIGEFSGLYQLIRLVVEGRIKVLPAAAGASLDLVPIDHVVAGLVALVERMAEADGGVFHLASGRPVPVAALRDLAQRFPHLHAPRFMAPEGFQAGVRTARERALDGQMAAYGSYLLRNPVFEVKRLAALTGLVCPATDAGFLHRIIGYGIEAGFLPAPGGRRARVA